MSSMDKSCEKKTTTAHSQNILLVDVLYNIKRKKYKTVCVEMCYYILDRDIYSSV
jgi:hypothetical protein